MPNQDTGPRLVIDPVPGSTQFRWRLEHDGQTLAMGVEIYPDKFSAGDGAAKSALMILHTLSSSYSRLCRQIRDAPRPGEEKTGEEGKAADEATCCDGGEESAISDDESELDAEVEARAEEKWLKTEAEAADLDDGVSEQSHDLIEQAQLDEVRS